MKRLKKKLLILLSTGLIVFLVLSGIIIFQKFQLSRFIDKALIGISGKQNLIVEIPDDVDRKDIRIDWYGPTDNPLTYTDSTGWGKIPYYEGNSCFLVYFKNDLIKSVGHFIISKHAYHDYKFSFHNISGKVAIDFRILGRDSTTAKDWDELYYWIKRPSDSLSITLQSDSGRIRNHADFTVEQEDLDKLLSPGIDTSLKKLEGTINDISYKIKTLKTRGSGSLNYRRKCYTVTLKDTAAFRDDDGYERKLKTFSLISLSMDNYYFRNRVANALLKEAKILDIFNTYSEVSMNSVTQGVYMVIEEPKKHLVDSMDASIIIRHRYDNSSFTDPGIIGRIKALVKKIIGYDKIEYTVYNDLSPAETGQYLGQYKSINKAIHKQKGEELYASLGKLMNIDEYMRIMAFNYIICNQDYTDEQFYYLSARDKSPVFNIMPWDFDDILGNGPHEGWRLREKYLGDKLIFSGENELDRTIGSDPVLYRKYLVQMGNVVNSLDESCMQTVYQRLYRELSPYFREEQIMKRSLDDLFQIEYKEDGLKDQLNGTYSFLVHRIKGIRAKLGAVKIDEN